MTRAIVLDFVSIFPHLQLVFAKWLKDQMQTDGVGPYQDGYVVATEQDKPFLLNLAAGIRIWPLKPGQDPTRAVIECTLSVRDFGKYSEVTVASHKPIVTSMVEALSTSAVKVSGLSLKGVHVPADPGTPAGWKTATTGWQSQWDAFVTKEAALALLKGALAEANACSPAAGFRQANLKPLMARKDVRWLNGRGLHQGMMRVLVTQAEQEGWLAADRTLDPSNPLVWLKAAPSPAPAQPPPDPVTKAVTAGPPANPVADPAPDPTVVPPTARPPSKRDRMEQVVKSRRLGPYTTLRLAIYQALPKVLAELPPADSPDGPRRQGQPLFTLLDQSKEKAKEWLQQYFESRKQPFRDGEQPWREIVRILAQVMPRAEAAIGEDGRPVPLGAKGMTVKVTDLAPDWDLRVDAELLFAYLEATDGLRQEDFDDIGGVLFHQFSPEGEIRERVAKLVTRLMDAGRVEERPDDNGIGFVYVVRTVAPTNRLLDKGSYPDPLANGSG